MLCEPHGTPTFMTEALRLVYDLQYLNFLILLNESLTQHYLSLFWPIASLLRPRLPTPSIAGAYNEIGKQ